MPLCFGQNTFVSDRTRVYRFYLDKQSLGLTHGSLKLVSEAVSEPEFIFL